ncbi:MAG TPA: sugar phosphate nucleotidyltransferase [Polyangiales bacterium]|nr:sugar phosphate nucleotidyltransferase [Polyangiales bacterium]
MKVVLFCGGMGTRLKDYSERIPKPLVEVGSRPILWHLMKWYAHYGHKEFILCLGHGARQIKDFFLKYDQPASCDFVMSEGGRKISLLDRDIQDWKITFVDTGLHSNVGERLRSVREYIEGDDYFLANYADGLCDLDLPAYIEAFRRRNKIACFISVPAPHTFHIVHSDPDQHATKLELVTRSPVRINGGFFVFRSDIFEHMQPGEELVVEPFQRLMSNRQLLAIPHTGFWRNMDTFKDKMELDELLNHGRGPWQVWQKH